MENQKALVIFKSKKYFDKYIKICRELDNQSHYNIETFVQPTHVIRLRRTYKLIPKGSLILLVKGNSKFFNLQSIFNESGSEIEKNVKIKSYNTLKFLSDYDNIKSKDGLIGIYDIEKEEGKKFTYCHFENYRHNYFKGDRYCRDDY